MGVMPDHAEHAGDPVKKKSAACAEGILNPPPHALAWLGRAELIPRTRGLASAPPSPSGSPHAAEQFPRQPLSAPLAPHGPLWPLFTPEISILGSPWPPFALLGALQAPLVVQDRPPSVPSVPQVTTMTPHDLNMCPK